MGVLQIIMLLRELNEGKSWEVRIRRSFTIDWRNYWRRTSFSDFFYALSKLFSQIFSSENIFKTFLSKIFYFLAQFRRIPYFAASNSVAKVKFRRCPLFSSYPSLTLPPPPLLPSSPPWRHLPCPTLGAALYSSKIQSQLFSKVCWRRRISGKWNDKIHWCLTFHSAIR